MIGPAAQARLVARLFDGDGALYAVLDGARSPRVYDLLRRSGAPHQPLYDGALDPALAEAAPHLVALEREHAFTAALLGEGWGESWGSFVASPARFPELRRHLRRFLRVRTEDGRTLLFRYYDPRVLRVYLPTCTPDELATFFGPITRFATEDDTGAAALIFERRGSALALETVPLPDRGIEAPSRPA